MQGGSIGQFIHYEYKMQINYIFTIEIGDFKLLNLINDAYFERCYYLNIQTTNNSNWSKLSMVTLSDQTFWFLFKNQNL